MAQRPSAPVSQSSGIASPPIRFASSAAVVNVTAARSTSVRLSLIGFAFSPVMLRAMSSR
jgi:hypothetical protein